MFTKCPAHTGTGATERVGEERPTKDVRPTRAQGQRAEQKYLQRLGASGPHGHRGNSIARDPPSSTAGSGPHGHRGNTIVTAVQMEPKRPAHTGTGATDLESRIRTLETRPAHTGTGATTRATHLHKGRRSSGPHGHRGSGRAPLRVPRCGRSLRHRCATRFQSRRWRGSGALGPATGGPLRGPKGCR